MKRYTVECPLCKSTDTRVQWVTHKGAVTSRKRICRACRNIFYTEQPKETLVKILTSEILTTEQAGN